MENSNKNLLAMAGTFVVGAAAGVLTGYLTAPRSGKHTRKKISKETKELVESAKEGMNSKVENLKEEYNHTLDKLAKNGKSLVNTARDKAKA